MANICRLCLSTVTPSSIIPVYKNRPPLEDQIKYLLPEIDMDLTSTFNLCNTCGNLLQTAYSFIRTCRETEETIANYISQFKSTPVNLNEVQKFQSKHFPAIHVDSSEDIKIEMHDVEIKTEISSVDVVENIGAAFVCVNCHKTFEDKQVVEQHQAGCFSFKSNQCEKLIRTSQSILMVNRSTTDLHEVEKSQIENSTRTHNVPEDVVAIGPQNLTIKTEIENVDETNLSNKCYEQFEDETMEKESGDFSLISKKLEVVKVERLDMEITAETDIDVRKQLNITYICNKCHKTFEDKETLDIHQKQCLFYKCDLCEETLVGKNVYVTPWGYQSIPETQTNLKSNKTFQGSESNDPNLKCEKSITGDICQSGFSSQMELQDHNLPHETSHEKYCNLTSHTQSKHEIDRPYKCPTCNISYKRKSHLTRHIECKHKIDRPYKCQTCDKSFNQKNRLTRHIQYQHEIGGPYKCQTCDMSFKRKSILIRHIKCKHKRALPYNCQTCNMNFKLRSHLRDHIKCKHEINLPYKCQTCGMGFQRKSTLIRHIQCRHEIDRPFKCQTCNMSFKRKSILTDHVKCKHEIDRPYKCDTCGKNFKLKSHLTDHTKLNHEIDCPYKCQTCDMSFDQKSNLTDHIKYNHKIDRPYKCQTCGMSFKRKDTLTRHIQFRHEIDRPYKCQACIMSFKRKDTLTRHIQLKHAINRPYKCKICDKLFAVPLALKVHLKTHAKSDEKLFI